MKKTNGFGLLGIIIIMVITAIVTSIATGVIMLNSSSEIAKETFSEITDDEELMNFIEIYDTLVSRYYDEIDKEGMLKAAEEGMLDFLGDKYTTYLDDAEYDSILNELSATYNGIGVTIENNKIIDITDNSPAEQAGLEKNDIILKINGIDVTQMDGNKIGNLIKNHVGIIILVIDRNGVELDFNIQKADLINIAIKHEVIENTQIGYLQIKKFSENLDKQVENALTDLENNNIKSLIIDVRDNVGGYLSAAEDTAELFLNSGKIIYSLETSNNTITYKDETKEKRTYPIAVLINNNSASAAEVLAAALKESYDAFLIGTKSYGKGKVQQIVGDSAKYTFAKWLTPSGNCIDGIGINPDYTISNNVDGIDYQLSKAIELLS